MNTAATTNTISTLTAGTYSVTITDNVGGGPGCSTTASVTITQNPVLNANITSSSDVTCAGDNDGSATVSISGGTGAGTYSILWDNGAGTNANATGLAGNTYTVVVTDGNGCTDSDVVTINENAAVTASIDASTDVTCFGDCDGDATVTPGGGTGAYTYKWDDPAPIQTTVTASSLCAGAYNVTVTDGNGCIATDNITINENAVVTASISSSQDVTCSGDADGQATVLAGGGDGAYSYNWSSGGTGATETGLSDGTYGVTVTDGNGCNANTSIVIDENNPVTAAITSFSEVTCFGDADGTATVTPGGGTGTYTYAWDNGAGTNATATGLTGITYTVVVTDGNSCTASDNIAINENTAVTASIDASTDVTCNGDCDGDATVTPGGGDGSYTYLWDDPIPAQTTVTAVTLCAGTYQVVVTDGNGCTAIDNITINENGAVTASIDASTNVTCNGDCDGTATVTPGGGDASYSYAWDNGVVQTTAAINSLCAGSYNVVVTDGNGCTATDNIVITENPVVVANITSTNDASCFGSCDGSMNVFATGGTGIGTYTYLWDDPLPQTVANPTGLCAGAYSVTVEDANGCSVIDNDVIGEPTALTLTTDTTEVLCNGGSTGTATVYPDKLII
jgi:hypothetical protein